MDMPTPRALPAADDMIAAVLERWPATVAVFLHRRMACAGCTMAPFMTVDEAADSYGIPLADLLVELRAAAQGNAPQGPFEPPLPHG
ncbi:MAG TPA: DUF1858 domain-containing protein [Azospirillum sp.]|nr:DUF1858 domain-containing protein [Azospirillum sp.]